MTKTHTVQQGETFVGIAFANGFRSWERIWNHPQNESLRSKRSSPDDIYVGDTIFIPDKEQKSVSLRAFAPNSDDTQVYQFVVKTAQLYVSFSLEDEDELPYLDKKYQLNANTPGGAKEITGRTTSEGMVSVALPPDTRSLDLTLWPDDSQAQDTVQWNFQLGATDPT